LHIWGEKNNKQTKQKQQQRPLSVKEEGELAGKNLRRGKSLCWLSLNPGGTYEVPSTAATNTEEPA